jgi:hypothetical protein
VLKPSSYDWLLGKHVVPCGQVFGAFSSHRIEWRVPVHVVGARHAIDEMAVLTMLE